MDRETGEILDLNQVQELVGKGARRNRFVEMQIPATPAQFQRRPPKIGRNEPCGCGSGKKFKNCCWTPRERG